jgi:GNAT superfamily N-acetyltransferase
MNGRIGVDPVPLDVILPWRDEYRREMNCQIVHDSWHARGFTTSYLLRTDGEPVGHGSIGGPPGEAKDVIKEFYVRARNRAEALPLFQELARTGAAAWVEAQTNDTLLSLMLYDTAADVTSEIILFHDAVSTSHDPPGLLRRIEQDERRRVFPHTREPVGDWGLEIDNEIVATGGFALHYNPPYADIYMEVAAGWQRRGLGRYLVQELKRTCRDSGYVPAARCRQDNIASRKALQAAGMHPCGRILRGRLGR